MPACNRKLYKNSTPLNGKSQRKARIFPSEGRRLLSCTKDHARLKITLFHAKSIVYFSLVFSVGRLLKKKKKKKIEKIAVDLISVYNTSNDF